MSLGVESHFHPGHPDLAIVTLNGAVDVTEVGMLRDRLTALLGAGARHLILDLSEVSFMDSTGLSVLAGVHRLLRAESHDGAQPAETGTLSLVGVNDRIRQLLRITALTKIFAIYRSVDVAVLGHTNRPHSHSRERHRRR